MRLRVSHWLPRLFGSWTGGDAVLTGVGTWLIGAAVLAVGIAIWQHRQSVLAETEVESRNLAVVSGEVASRTVQAVDIVLRDAQERFGGIGRTPRRRSAARLRAGRSTRSCAAAPGGCRRSMCWR